MSSGGGRWLKKIPNTTLFCTPRRAYETSRKENGGVACCQNMVGPGEVDGDLELETAEECQKYGKVAKCVIYEVSSRSNHRQQPAPYPLSILTGLGDKNGRLFIDVNMNGGMS